MDKPSKEKDNSFATPKVSLQPFLPEFGVTAGCNSFRGGEISTTSALGRVCFGLPNIAGTIVAGVSADIHPDAPVPRRFRNRRSEVGTDLSLQDGARKPPKKIILNGVE